MQEEQEEVIIDQCLMWLRRKKERRKGYSGRLKFHRHLCLTVSTNTRHLQTRKDAKIIDDQNKPTCLIKCAKVFMNFVEKTPRQL